jgi:long-chain acyl-CoA synthetase
MNIADWLATTARLHPNAPALLKGAQLDADYQTFARRAAAIGRHLQQDYGVQPGDRIGLFSANCTEYLECLYGVWWAGAAVVPINAKLHPREALGICADSGVKLLIVSDETQPTITEVADAATPPMLSLDSAAYQQLRDGDAPAIPAAREDDDLAWLFYTSGTTGRPKGVMLCHRNLISMSLCYLADVDQVTPDDTALYAAPVSHGAGMYNFIHVRIGDSP